MEDPGATEFSEQLAPAFQGLINEELSKRGGGMATAFIGLVNYIDEEGTQCWSLVASEGQPISQSAGMLAILNRLIDAQLHEALFHD